MIITFKRRTKKDFGKSSPKSLIFSLFHSQARLHVWNFFLRLLCLFLHVL